MRIAMLTTTGDHCGIASYTRSLLDGLRSLDDIDVNVVPITEGVQPSEHYAAQADEINAADIDVVHIQHEYSFWGGALPRAKAFWELRYRIQKPVVLTAHTIMPLADLLRYSVERRPHVRAAKWALMRLPQFARYRDTVMIAPFVVGLTIVHTANDRAELIRRGAKPQFLHVVPGGVPHALPPAGIEDFIARFGLQGRRVVSLFGFTSPNKGYEVMLRAMASLPREVVFLIAGGSRDEAMESYHETLKREIAASGQAERVVITGFLSEAEIAQAMRASEIVIAPHTQATNSYSVALPIAYGRPIIASSLACFREMQARQECLRLVAPGSADELAAAINTLLGDEAERNRLTAGAERYASRFSWESAAKRTVGVYREAIRICAQSAGSR